MKNVEGQDLSLVEFLDPNVITSWTIINDGVMGGMSRSEMVYSPEGMGSFIGTVSLKNNGGFASVRKNITENIPASMNGIKIRIRGDGKVYSFRLRMDNAFDGVSYAHTFTTKAGVWEEHELPFPDFVPTFRGRILNDRPPVNPESIKQLGLLISDRQEGNFRIDIEWIKAYH